MEGWVFILLFKNSLHVFPLVLYILGIWLLFGHVTWSSSIVAVLKESGRPPVLQQVGPKRLTLGLALIRPHLQPSQASQAKAATRFAAIPHPPIPQYPTPPYTPE